LDGALVPQATRLAEMIPGALLEVIPEAGHSPQFERPELFNAALRKHLDRNGGSSSK
jgi:3-oxoadipate enol-lactonase